MPFKSVKIRKKSGSQFIPLPPGMEIDDDKVYIKKIGTTLYVVPFHNPWDSLIESTGMFTKDFMDERVQPASDERELFE